MFLDLEHEESAEQQKSERHPAGGRSPTPRVYGLVCKITEAEAISWAAEEGADGASARRGDSRADQAIFDRRAGCERPEPSGQDRGGIRLPWTERRGQNDDAAH